MADLKHPFDSLPSQQMIDALNTVGAMARDEIASGHGLPHPVDEFHDMLAKLRRRVISNEQACAWSDYRKAYGVNEANLTAEHKAFIAGWEAGQGKSFEEGPLR